ncbi:putative resolvase, partial [Pseudomonas syringae pv. actinidiae ICMP 19070]
ASGVYKGRPVDAELRNRVRELLAAGLGIRAVARHAACSTTTVMKVRTVQDEAIKRVIRAVVPVVA